MPEIEQTRLLPTLLRHVLDLGLRATFSAGGSSMLPTIHDGDRLVLEATDPKALRRGDVILAEYGGSLRAHRIIRLPGGNERNFVMRGDALLSPDAPLDAQQILGRVIEVERAGRRRPVSGILIRAGILLRRSLLSLRRMLPGPLQSLTNYAVQRIRGLAATIVMSGEISRGNRGAGI